MSTSALQRVDLAAEPGTYEVTTRTVPADPDQPDSLSRTAVYTITTTDRPDGAALVTRHINGTPDDPSDHLSLRDTHAIVGKTDLQASDDPADPGVTGGNFEATHMVEVGELLALQLDSDIMRLVTPRVASIRKVA